ncbi:glycosyltransferase [Glycomyces harbinensis]|uniref:Glycosyltransferase involved in cell wall bisynthesis n=1 Tax=Glycomyces harbinensis TaxID=58114 RepID=A0A1G6UXF7_9ACTN|nr:glycosyltransferase [Glycomyces harbinensis]SDD45968.1 Glycosyltransferase involved in cell wall bisynthesis [Glycomyces harbinensis]
MRETANQFAAQGWDVTVVTIEDESWELDSGVDHTLSEQVDPRVNVVKLPLRREDLETDIRGYSAERAVDPPQWVKSLRERNAESFPEPTFGGWRGALEEAVLRLHRERPADLLLTSCVPYVSLAAAWRLWEEARVPYAVDFRDGWSIDVIDGNIAFGRDSAEGRWEERILGSAISLWTVNDPIAEHYRGHYPEYADRVHVVRNGYDADSAPARPHRPDPDSGLVFGYLGTATFPTNLLRAVLEGWHLAREREPLLANARFEFRGHTGNGSQRGTNRQVEILREAASDGVSFGGPVAKADVAATYGAWDALVLIITGGHYMTSGKVYEYMATGLPIVSAHAADHDATNLLQGRPLWTGAHDVDSESMAASFVKAAHMSVESTDEQYAAAMTHAHQFARESIMAAAVKNLISELQVRKGHTQ